MKSIKLWSLVGSIGVLITLLMVFAVVEPNPYLGAVAGTLIGIAAGRLFIIANS